MKTYPLTQLNISEAAELQFRIVDAITRYFPENSFLSCADVGLVPALGRPRATVQVEKTLADIFGAEAAVLVRGAGTGAIRSALATLCGSGKELFIHDAPLYPSTDESCKEMGIHTLRFNYNDMSVLRKAYRESAANCTLVQISRQKLDDSYNHEEIIAAFKKERPERPIITDDNYTVMKIKKIGCQCGADISCFSLFKLLGPAGIGCLVGKRYVTEKIQSAMYSGGVQVQGYEAMDALRSLVYTPLALAVQAQTCSEIAKRLNEGEVKGVKRAFIANAQSRVVIVEFQEPLMPELLKKAALFGASEYPVGCESRYEIAPLFYRISGTFLKTRPEMQAYMLRINPLRAGADTVISILRRAMGV